MGNYKWNINDSNKELPYVVILMTSRNKDNKNIPNFKQRKVSKFCSLREDKIFKEFEFFASQGVPGETSRLYISLNARDTKKVQKELLHTLIDKDDLVFDYIEPTIAGIAAKKENAAEKKWFFDFDSQDSEEYLNFVKDLTEAYGEAPDIIYPTLHGFAIVVAHGFDTRKLLEKWGHIVALKRDDLICRKWITK